MLRVASRGLFIFGCVLAVLIAQPALAKNITVSGPLLIDSSYPDKVDNVIIKSGGDLEVEDGATIHGNIIVQSGGNLVLDVALVKGNVVVQNGASVVVNFSEVKGNVVASGYTFLLIGSIIKGNLNVSQATDSVLITGLDLGGNMILSNNDTELGIAVDSATIRGNFILTNNSDQSGVIFVEFNTIRGNLIATNNDPTPDVTNNTVNGNVIVH